MAPDDDMTKKSSTTRKRTKIDEVCRKRAKGAEPYYYFNRDEWDRYGSPPADDAPSYSCEVYPLDKEPPNRQAPNAKT